MDKKGFIPVKGTINGYPFKSNLVPVKNSVYRLFVNLDMRRGAKADVGDTAPIIIEIDLAPRVESMPKELKLKLEANNLLDEFNRLLNSRRKEILTYLNYLKTKTSLMKNIEKVINELRANS